MLFLTTRIECINRNPLFLVGMTLLGVVAAAAIITFTVLATKISSANVMCDESDRATDLFDRFWTWRLQNAPEFATEIGNHIYDDRLDEMSLPSYMRRQNAGESFLGEVKELLATVPASQRSLRLNLNLLKLELETFIQGCEHHTYTFPLNHLEGPQVDFPKLVSYAKKSSNDDYNKLLKRFNMFPLKIEEIITLMKRGIKEGRTMHQISIADVPKQMRDIVKVPLEDSKFFEGFVEKPDNILTNQWNEIVKTGRRLITDEILPAYAKLADFIENEYKNHTRDNIAASSLPNGQDYYKQCLKFHTSTNWTAQQVHDLGKSEVKRIKRKMIDIMKETNYNGTLEQFKEYMKTDSQFKFTSQEEMLSVYNEITSKITELLPRYFKRIPDINYVIKEVPAEIAKTFTSAYYSAPPENGLRPGVFYINTHEPGTRKKYDAVALSLHEAEPGHHLQQALSIRQDSLVDFRRFNEDRKYYEAPARFAMDTAYVEGWALYSEYLGEEMGLYSSPYDMFGRLSYEMLRACRLVVDTGIHALGWSKERALQYMKENTVLSSSEVEKEINRYITWPGQACGYKVGELKIKELREKAESALGENFDVREFHDLVASIGGVPLFVLENQIDDFITKFQ